MERVRSSAGSWNWRNIQRPSECYGNGRNPYETAAGAAVREVWEECGAHVVIEGTEFAVTSPYNGVTSSVFLARLLRQEASPGGRKHAWVAPTQTPWCDDYQLAPALNIMRERSWP